MSEEKTYRGQCHCGAVEFEIDTDLVPVVRCNCSLCQRKGAIMHRTDGEHFRLIKGAGNLSLYQFHTHKAKEPINKSSAPLAYQSDQRSRQRLQACWWHVENR